VGAAIDLLQQPILKIKYDHRPGIADMDIVINGRSADIHAHIGGIERLEFLLGPGGSIVQAHGHVLVPSIRHNLQTALQPLCIYRETIIRNGGANPDLKRKKTGRQQ
jgi:hypothetical protein